MKHDAANALPSRPSPGAAGARLAELYEGHARMVYGVCRLLLRDPDEAEDAAQQVFLSAYRSLLAGTKPRDPGAWLGTIARNEALLFRGRRRLQQRLRPGFAAGVLVVPLTLRESIAYAVPGFAAGGASTAGVLAKLAGVPLAAKLAAAGVAVSVAGSAGVLAERELRDASGRPPRVPVEQATPVAPIATAVRVFSSPVRMEAADEPERDKAHVTDDAGPAEADESGELEERGQESLPPVDADDDRHAWSTTQTVESGDENGETEATEPDEPDHEPDDRSSDGGDGD